MRVIATHKFFNQLTGNFIPFNIWRIDNIWRTDNTNNLVREWCPVHGK